MKIKVHTVFVSMPTGRIQQVACILNITCMCITYDGEVVENVSVSLACAGSESTTGTNGITSRKLTAYLEPSHYWYLRNLCQQILLVVIGPTFLQALLESPR